MSLKARMLTISAAGLLVALTGCGSSASTTDATAPSASSTTSGTSPTTSTATSPAPSSSAPAAEPVMITIKDFMYTVPASVAPGAVVTVTNQDSQNHTVTSGGAFDVNVTGRGGTATFTAPSKAGSYPIICKYHANMAATLVVT